MSIIDRVQQLDLPLDQVVVIGSGLLDALGLRAASDVDLVLAPELFDNLPQQAAGWSLHSKDGNPMLKKGDTEAFLSWDIDGRRPSFTEFYDNSLEVSGVNFANPDTIIAYKRRRDSPKDRQDIELLSEHFKYEQ